jgi:serine/threonine-protein kinase
MDGGRDHDPDTPGAGPEGEGPPPGEADAGAIPAAAAQPPASRRGGRRLRSVVSLVAFAAAAFLTGLLVFNYLVMPRLIHGGGEVAVPDLAGLTYEQAEQAARSLQMQLSRAGERFDPSVPTGRVLSQDPPAGTPARGAQRILVVLSLGEEYASVPELYGESLRGARLLIERAGLQIGGMTHAPSEDVGEGLVAASDPPAESVLPRGTPVGLLVSTGPGTETFVMPDVLGREIGSARRQLEALGFRVLVPPSGGIVGAVVFQDPGAGSRITRDVTITLQATGRIIR